MVEADDLGGGREALAGEVPDPYRAVAEDDELADMLGAAAAGLGLGQVAELGGGGEGGQVAGGARVADRAALCAESALGEQAGELDLPGAGPSVRVLAGPAGGLRGHHRHAGAVDGDVERVRRAGRRKRDDPAGQDRRGSGLGDRGRGRAVGLGGPLHAPGGQLHAGELGQQAGRPGEWLAGSCPGDHLAQPR